MLRITAGGVPKYPVVFRHTPEDVRLAETVFPLTLAEAKRLRMRLDEVIEWANNQEDLNRRSNETNEIP